MRGISVICLIGIFSLIKFNNIEIIGDESESLEAFEVMNYPFPWRINDNKQQE